MQQPQSLDHHFVSYLESLAVHENRGALADLRRGLGKGPGEAPEMFPYLAPFTQNLSYRRERDFYLLASLFGLHPQSWNGDHAGNIGASLRAIGDEGGGVERRFVALLNARWADLDDHLRHVISLCAAHDVPIDWNSLLADLRRWDAASRSVQRSWARSFWQSPPAPSND